MSPFDEAANSAWGLAEARRLQRTLKLKLGLCGWGSHTGVRLGLGFRTQIHLTSDPPRLTCETPFRFVTFPSRPVVPSGSFWILPRSPQRESASVAYPCQAIHYPLFEQSPLNNLSFPSCEAGFGPPTLSLSPVSRISGCLSFTATR